jgi:lysophospholipid acyltransferase (LPLAT)-like uncharacterized protein
VVSRPSPARGRRDSRGFNGFGFLGRALGWLVRAWAWTWKVELLVSAGARLGGGDPRVFAFWHGQQMGLVGARRRRSLAVLVSWSQDGDLQAGVMRSLGLGVVRGSSSRGGAVGLYRIVRLLRNGSDAAFAVDGPRGPHGIPKAGAARAACLGKALLVPVSSAASSKWVIKGAWDRFEVPLPFARVVIAMGEPLDTSFAKRHAPLLARAIDLTRRAAEQRVST